jgi:CheY-like chemotaxis protein
LRDEAKDAELRQQAEMVLEASNRGADLVRQLMAFARKQELEPKVLDLHAMLGPFAKLVRRTLQENITIDVRTAEKLPLIKVDPGRLETAVLNLVLNARDAMPDGGKITIETELVKLDRDYAGANIGVRPGSYVMVSVTDTGTGMEKAVAEKAFEPFFTTKEVGRGTGLGLSMVYGFVKQTGGHAKIYSEPGHGTTIKIYLPPTKEEAQTAAMESDETQFGDTATILVVEDDELVRKSVCKKLQRFGYTVTAVEAASAALMTLEKNPNFDLVFSDVIMPGSLSGADLAREVQSRWPQIKLLLTSGYTEASALGKVKVPPGVRLLSKPYSSAELAKTVSAVLMSGNGKPG